MTEKEEIFIKKANLANDFKYNYNKLVYVNSRTPVIVKCKEHGDFYQRPDHHLNGVGCPKCGNLIKTKKAIEARRVTKDKFLTRSRKTHNDTYDYSLVQYKKISEQINVICRLHGVFKCTAYNHLKGSGCPKCGNISVSHKLKIPQEKIIERLKLIHGNTYDYSKVVTNGITGSITIICRTHGEFQQIAYVHATGFGCSRCSSSKGEKILADLLTKNNIEFMHQYKLPNTNYRYRYDFYLPKYNALIEFQGEQHYVPVDYFGGEEGFRKTKFRDSFKKGLAELCGINLIYFNYKHLKLDEEKFETILLKTIEGVTFK